MSETLRDKFAMAALTGLLSYSMSNPATGNYHENCSKKECCRTAYKYADVMLLMRAIKMPEEI